MLKFLSIIPLVVFLSSCGGGGGGGGSDGNANDTVAVSGVGQTITVNSVDKTDLDISGIGNTINIETDLGALTLSGEDNVLNFASGIVVDSCAVSGTGNTAQKAGPVTMTCDDSGVGNTGF